MSLAYLSNYFPSLTETFIYREVLELRRRGVTVTVYSLRKPDPSSLSEEAVPLFESTRYLLPVSIPRVVSSHLKFLICAPRRYVKVLLKMVLPVHKSLKDRMRSMMHFGEGVVLAGMMERDGISHIHAHYASQAASVARVIHLATGKPYSFTGHAHDIWLDRLLLPEKLREACFVTTCSQMGRKWLLAQTDKAGAKKVHVVYHGLDITHFRPRETKEGRENVVLSVGRLTEQKGLPDLVAACAVLRDRGMKVRCEIIGEGEDRESLTRLIKSYNLEEQVQLIGAVRQEEIRSYYEGAAVFALPSVDTRDGNRDGIPNVLMEAMAMGLPVITTANSGQAELIDSGVHGIIVPCHAPGELADAIMRVLSNDKLRDRMSREARKRVERDFDNRNTIEPLLHLLDAHGCLVPSMPSRPAETQSPNSR